jgi:hypothetical protein
MKTIMKNMSNQLNIGANGIARRAAFAVIPTLTSASYAEGLRCVTSI